jgi:hypothetical protein
MPAHHVAFVWVEHQGRNFDQPPANPRHYRTTTPFVSHETPRLTRVTAA